MAFIFSSIIIILLIDDQIKGIYYNYFSCIWKYLVFVYPHWCMYYPHIVQKVNL